MIKENQFVKIKCNNKHKKYYTDKGYTAKEDFFIVNVNDLPDGSKANVLCICDYCGKEFYKSYSDYKKQVSKTIAKCCCKNCIKEKFKETCMNIYGCESPFQNECIRNKISSTVLDKYGVDVIGKSKSVRNKISNTNRNKYGCISPLGNKDVIKKSKSTLMKNYNVENPMQNDDIKNKSINSLREGGNLKCSKQQRLLNEYIGGILNFPFMSYAIDIALDNNIAVEYNGGGHNLNVKLGYITQKQFNQKEMTRKTILYKNGWKIITFISQRDLLPEKSICNAVISFAIEYFNTNNRHWLEFDIDKMEIKTSQFIKNINEII